jgi:hypothetical protein
VLSVFLKTVVLLLFCDRENKDNVRRQELEAYVNLSATVQRCREELQMLNVEVKSAVDFYEEQASWLSGRLASRPLSTAAPNSLEQGTAQKLRAELAKVRRRLRAMQDARATITGQSEPSAASSPQVTVEPPEAEEDDLAVYDGEPEDVDSALAEESLVGSGDSDCEAGQASKPLPNVSTHVRH